MAEDVFSARPSDKPIALLVLGMHRSGTSVLTGMLHLLGVDLGRHLMKPSRFNPTGYWEYKPLVDLQIAMLSSIGSTDDDYLPLPDGWENRPAAKAFEQEFIEMIWKEFAGKKIWGFKDPRTCRLVPMWHSLLAELRMESRFILAVRDPAEVAASWHANDGQRYIKTALMTLTHMLQMERHTRGHKRVVVTYNQVMTDPTATLQRAGKGLGIEWPHSLELSAPRLAEFIDPKLRHHRVADESASEQALIAGGTDPQIARWVISVYNAIASAAQDEPTETALAKAQPFLDRVAADFEKVAPAYLHWRPLGTPWWMPLTG